MKRLLSLLSILVLGIFLSSCQKDSAADGPFTIVGNWGMVEGTIDGKEYGPMGPGAYYQEIEFKANGTYVENMYSSVNTGVYTYDPASKYLQMKDSQYSYYVPTHVTIHTAIEITLVMDYGKAGVVTKHLVKLTK